MKKSLKMVSILMMAIMMVMVATPVFATGVNPGTTIDGINIDPPDATDTNGIMGVVNSILGFLQWGAIIGGVLIITILGIKYMMGSLEEKAEYKKSMIPLIVGIIVVMGATSIAKLLFSVFVTGA